MGSVSRRIATAAYMGKDNSASNRGLLRVTRRKAAADKLLAERAARKAKYESGEMTKCGGHERKAS